MMNKGLVDIGLFLEPVSTEGLDYIRLTGSDRWVVGMRPDDPLANWFGKECQSMGSLLLRHIFYDNSNEKKKGRHQQTSNCPDLLLCNKLRYIVQKQQMRRIECIKHILKAQSPLPVIPVHKQHIYK